MGMPLVSIYMPTHNRASRLMRSVSSVLSQTYSNIELCIVDDGSIDDTWSICKELEKKYENIRVVRHNEAKGACAARNTAISMARGEFITGIDDDDEFLNERIQAFVDLWDDELSFICANFFNCYSYEQKRHFLTGGVFSVDDLKLNNEAGNQIFTKLSYIRAVGGFDLSVKKLQDWDVWLRLAARFGPFKRLSSVLYRMHHEEGDRVSNNLSFSFALQEMIDRQLDLYSDDEIYLLERYLIHERSFPDIRRELKFFGSSRYTKFILKKVFRNAIKGL